MGSMVSSSKTLRASVTSCASASRAGGMLLNESVDEAAEGGAPTRVMEPALLCL